MTAVNRISPRNEVFGLLDTTPTAAGRSMAI